MESVKRNHHSSLFLLELMITILLFAVTSAVCIRVFGEAHHAARQAQVLTEATRICSSMGEIIRASSSTEEAELLLQDAYPLLFSYGNAMEMLLEDGSQVEILPNRESDLQKFQIRYLTPEETCVYELEIVKFDPEVSS